MPLDIIKAVANGDEDKAKEVHKGIIDLGLGPNCSRRIWRIRT